jgi:hypothetical protein
MFVTSQNDRSPYDRAWETGLLIYHQAWVPGLLVDDQACEPDMLDKSEISVGS